MKAKPNVAAEQLARLRAEDEPLRPMLESEMTNPRPAGSLNEQRHSFRYAAFISYRHVEPDQAWAKWLHTSLETYRVPGSLLSKGLPPRLGKLFRDNEELTAVPDLGAEIEEALRASRFLIVVCSAKTPDSSWVNKEIQFFRKLGRDAHILALLVEGEPEVAFPRSLCEVSTDAAADKHRAEPLAADVRFVAGESSRLRRRLALLRIASRLLNCRFDDLLQRDAERRRRRIYQAGLVTMLVGLTVLSTTGFGLYWQEQAAKLQIQSDARRETDKLKQSHRQEQALAAKGRVMAQLPDLRRRALWAQAQTLISEVRTLHDPDSDPAVGEELAREDSNIRLLEKLDVIRMRKAALAAENPDKVWNAGEIRQAYQKAFLQAGYAFSGSDREEVIITASNKLEASSIKDELVAALDDWAWGVKEDDADVIWETTARVTGREWRKELRITSLSAPEALWLIREVPINDFTPALVTGLGFTMRLFIIGDKHHAVNWMEAGAKHYPSDFWVNFYLGIEYMRLKDVESATGAFRAAVALRPDALLPRKCLDKCREEIKSRR